MLQYCITDLKSAQAVIKLMLKTDPDLRTVGVSRTAYRRLRNEVYKTPEYIRGEIRNRWASHPDRKESIVPVTYIQGVVIYGKD